MKEGKKQWLWLSKFIIWLFFGLLVLVILAGALSGAGKGVPTVLLVLLYVSSGLLLADFLILFILEILAEYREKRSLVFLQLLKEIALFAALYLVVNAVDFSNGIQISLSREVSVLGLVLWSIGLTAVVKGITYHQRCARDENSIDFIEK